MKSSRIDKSPRDFKNIKKFQKKGLIIIHTGDGKGKSTAAFGTAIRAMGRGLRVGIVQFIKGKWQTGESKFFKNSKNQCDFISIGDGFTWETQNFAQDVKTAQKAWKKCCEFLHDGQHQLVIFDEINYVLKYNFLDTQDVLHELKKKPFFKHVILTGNGAPPKLIEFADLVTEMKCVKHPYYQGIAAQPGIEY